MRRDFPEILEEAIRRPVGAAGLLISMTERQLHSKGGREVGKLRLSDTILGCGQVLTGVTTAARQAGASRLSAECRALQGAATRRPARGQSFHISTLSDATDSVLGLGELEVEVAALCKACKGCGECRFRREKCSEEERQVLEQVESEMVLEEGRLTASYPWLPCADKMRSNRQQVEKIQERIEARLLKNGLHQAYIEEFQKAEAKGTVVELTREEINNYRGPVNYNNHFEVIKEGSSTTKLRIVSNSAQKNARSGLSLNDCMARGPDLLALLEEVLLHFRTVESAIILDLEKAYQAIYTREKEKHLRRILWRTSPGEDWKDYAYTRATFGDLAAGLLLEAAKHRAADEGEHLDPVAADQLRKRFYVDDGVVGGQPSDVERMRGKEVEPGQYDGTIAKILSTCGLKAKFMVVTGDQDPKSAEHLGGKVLGLSYRLAEDHLDLIVPMQFKVKSRASQKKVIKLSSEELERIRSGRRPFTKREALSFVMGAFDPLGYLGPALLPGKLLLRRLYGEGAPSWDDDLPAEEKEQWVAWLLQLAREGSVAMKRCVRPIGAKGEPILAGFCDASVSAMCAVLYVVWDTEERTESRLLLAKVRVTPLHGTSVPRSELQAMVMLVRILVVVVRAAAFTSRRMTLATDSACCVAALKRSGAALHPFFSNRVAEITQTLENLRKESPGEVERFCHIEGKLNPADVGTCPGVCLSELGPSSLWQTGPKFLVELPR